MNEQITPEQIENLFYLDGKMIPSRFSARYIEKNKLSHIIEKIMIMHSDFPNLNDKIKIISNRMTPHKCKMCDKDIYPDRIYCSKSCRYKDPETQKMLKDKLFEKHGVTHASHMENHNEKRVKTNLDRYGVEYYAQTSEFKNKYNDAVSRFSDEKRKSISNKSKKTNFDKTGYISNLLIPEIIEKSQKNAWSDEARSKRTATNFEKYSGPSPLNCIKIQEKSKNTKLERYGYLTKSYDISKEYLTEEYVNKGLTYQEIADNLGVAYATVQRYIYMHEIPINYNRWQSSHEREISTIYKNDFIVQENIRFLNKFSEKFEIDVYFPDYNLGVECDGLLWHSNFSATHDKNYHLNKHNQAKESNIKLLQFFSNDIINSFEKVKSIININLGLYDRIFARKCQIREITSEEYVKFCNENHIQNHAKAKIKIGLFYNTKLVSLMSFNSSRFDKKYEWELVRYCSLLNTTVVGGGEKLFSYFIKTYNPENIISYCDKRLFSGKIYEKLGFSFIKDTVPGFYFTDGNKIYPRQMFQKHKLTETFNTKKLYKIYNSGNSVWAYRKTPC